MRPNHRLRILSLKARSIFCQRRIERELAKNSNITWT